MSSTLLGEAPSHSTICIRQFLPDLEKPAWNDPKIKKSAEQTWIEFEPLALIVPNGPRAEVEEKIEVAVNCLN